MSGDFGKQSPLDLEVFSYGLDDPITIFQAAEVIFKIPDTDVCGNRRNCESCRLSALEIVDRLRRQRIAISFFRNDIQQEHRQTGICDVGGNTSSHCAGAEYSGTPNIELTIYFFLAGKLGTLGRRRGNQQHALVLDSRSSMNGDTNRSRIDRLRMRILNAWSKSQRARNTKKNLEFAATNIALRISVQRSHQLLVAESAGQDAGKFRGNLARP